MHKSAADAIMLHRVSVARAKQFISLFIYILLGNEIFLYFFITFMYLRDFILFILFLLLIAQYLHKLHIQRKT